MSGHDGGWEQFDTTCSLISAPQWYHTPPVDRYEFIHGQINAACESRPADLVILSPVTGLSAWIVLECGFHVKL